MGNNGLIDPKWRNTASAQHAASAYQSNALLQRPLRTNSALLQLQYTKVS